MAGDTHSTRCFLHKIYSISYISDLHSPFMSDELPGRSGTTITELRLDLALVKATIKRTLVSDHLIESINTVFSDDSYSLHASTCLLSRSVKCSHGMAFEAIESHKLMSMDGLAKIEPKTHPERVFSGWLDMAVDVLSEEFGERGWI